MAVTASSVRNLRAKRGLPFTNQLSGWIVLGMIVLTFPFGLALFALTTFHLKAASTLYPLFQLHFTRTSISQPERTSAECKLLIYFLTFCPLFVLLSIKAEGLFYVAYCVVLGLWVWVEVAVREVQRSLEAKESGDGVKGKNDGAVKNEEESGWNPMGLKGDDVRIAMVFLFLVQVGFFGTGK